MTLLFTDIEGRRGCCTSSATGTAMHSTITAGSCARPVRPTTVSRSIRRVTHSSWRSRGRRTRLPILATSTVPPNPP